MARWLALVTLFWLVGCGDDDAVSGASPAVAPPTSAAAELGGLRGWSPYSLTVEVETIAPGRISTPSGELVASVGLGAAGTPTISPDGRVAAFGGERPVVRDVETGVSRRLRLPADHGVLGIELLDAERLALWGTDGGGGAWVALLDGGTLAVHGAYRTASAWGCALFATSTSQVFCIVEPTMDYETGERIAGSGYVLTLDREGAARAVVADTHGVTSAAAGHRAMVAFFDGVRDEVVLLDTAEGTSSRFSAPIVDHEDGYVTSMDFSPDGSLLAIGTFASVLTSHRVPSGELVRTLAPTGTELHGVRVENDGTLLREARDLLTLSPPAGEESSLPSPCGHVGAVALTPTTVVNAVNDGLCVIDRSTGALDARRSAVTRGGAMVWRGDTLTLVYEAFDADEQPLSHMVRYDLRQGRMVAAERDSAAVVRALGLLEVDEAVWSRRWLPFVISPDGRYAAERTEEGRVRIVDGQGRRIGGELDGEVALGARGTLVSRDAAGIHRHARAGDAGRLLEVADLPPGGEIVLTPGGEHLLVRGERAATLVRLADGVVTGRYVPASIGPVAISPDGATAIVAVCEPSPGESEDCADALVRLSIPALSAVDRLALDARPEALAFAPNGEALAVRMTGEVRIVATSGWGPQ